MGNELQTIGERGVNGKIRLALDTITHLDWISMIAMDSTSSSADEKYAWLGAVPQMREWLGPRVAKKLREFDYTIRNKKFETTLEVANDDMDREKVDQLDMRIDELALRAETHWAKLVSDLIKNNDTCYDGQDFFSASHSSGDSGTLANTLAKANYTSLDFTTTAKPTAIEMAAALLDVAAHFRTFKDDVGEPINEEVSNFLVVVPTVDYYTAAIQAIKSTTLTTSGGAAAMNPLTNTGLNFTLRHNARLTTGDATTGDQYFYVFVTDKPIKAFILQQEKAITQQSLGEGSDHEFNNDSKLFGIKAKRNAGYGLWQSAIRADGTT